MTTLLLDLDGVLRAFGPDEPIEDAHGLPHGSLAAAAFAVVGPALVGEQTDRQWRAAIVDRLVADGVDRAVAEPAVRDWSRIGSVVPEAVALVRRVRPRARVAVLTNATDRVFADLGELGLDREVDTVVSSAVLGVAKPAPEAFAKACDVLGVRPADTVFVDDSERNVAGALAAGLDAAHAPDHVALERVLAERGLLGPLLLVLHDRDEALAVAAELRAAGWTPCLVHRELLAGEDDAEDADWVVELAGGPDGPAAAARAFLEELADRHDGFVTD
ncbi:HAD family hydrolase [Actinosynnema sp. NPDC020468]|uniref:HAD family hydrolase n=1 Tax=Actinosynnema sp. NPDC020468 TaxID=3154488 RepID=UPI0033E3198E